MARLLRVTLFTTTLAVIASTAYAQSYGSEPAEVTTAAPYSSKPSEITTAAPYSSEPAEVTTAAPYSSQPAEVTTSAPYSSQPAEVTTQAPYGSQPAEVTTQAPYGSQPAEITTLAPYSSEPAEITTQAPYSSSAPYSSQHAEVTTQAPYGSEPAEATTQAPYGSSAPYSSQPAEITTLAPYGSSAPYSSLPAEITTQAPYGSSAPYSSQPAEITTQAPYGSSAPYSSQPAEVTTSAPYGSQPAEVTTQAPYGSQPAEVTTQAPASSGSGCQWVYVDAQLVLSGASWANVQGNANAWSSLNGAITADVASLLGRSVADIAIQSITAANNALTVTFTARSNALAEAARIAALIRDDVPATAPLAATDGVYASVAGSSQDVSVASHTATSRDVFDGCGVSSSQPAEITTQAPYGSSQPSEVTTQAPAASGSGECVWVYIDAQFVLSGASWANVRGNANAWSSLSGAFSSDVATLIGRTPADISIQSIAAANNALTVTFTARSDALAQAARIAALIRDDVPATAPLPAVNGVYTSVAGSSQDVNVASHTAASRDTYDCTGASSSQPSEITTPAPYGASQPSEVTTQAPAGAPTSYAPSTPSTPSGYAPSASSFPVYAALLLSGSGWQQIAASAWNALKAALASDIASALNLGTGSITINIMQATTTGLRVNYTVMTTSVQSAGEVTAETSQLDSALQLPATSVLYQQANPSTKNGTVSVSWAGSSSNFYTSPAGSLTAWMPLLASAAAVAAVAALVH